ncbi:MAG: DUF5947 family protein, partial [Vulcanimicrobiaceae bacterium]
MDEGASAVNDFAALRGMLKQRKVVPGEVCDLCATPVGATHSHVIELNARRILCSCRPCYLLFTHEGAAQGRYKAIPSRFLRIADFAVDEAAWDELQIPIGLAFFFVNSLENKMLAFYPGPAGATESQLPLETWQSIAAGYPQ